MFIVAASAFFKSGPGRFQAKVPTMMRIVALVSGVIAVLLGALCLLQSLGIVHVRPILCFADCAPVQGPSSTCAVVGADTIAVGGLAIFWSRRRLTQRPGPISLV